MKKLFTYRDIVLDISEIIGVYRAPQYESTYRINIVLRHCNPISIGFSSPEQLAEFKEKIVKAISE